MGSQGLSKSMVYLEWKREQQLELKTATLELLLQSALAQAGPTWKWSRLHSFTEG